MTPAELRQFRSKLGLTQAQLATMLRVSRNTVTRWESGACEITRVIEFAVRWAAALDRAAAESGS